MKKRSRPFLMLSCLLSLLFLDCRTLPNHTVIIPTALPRSFFIYITPELVTNNVRYDENGEYIKAGMEGFLIDSIRPLVVVRGERKVKVETEEGPAEKTVPVMTKPTDTYMRNYAAPSDIRFARVLDIVGRQYRLFNAEFSLDYLLSADASSTYSQLVEYHFEKNRNPHYYMSYLVDPAELYGRQRDWLLKTPGDVIYVLFSGEVLAPELFNVSNVGNVKLGGKVGFNFPGINTGADGRYEIALQYSENYSNEFILRKYSDYSALEELVKSKTPMFVEVDASVSLSPPSSSVDPMTLVFSVDGKKYRCSEEYGRHLKNENVRFLVKAPAAPGEARMSVLGLPSDKQGALLAKFAALAKGGAGSDPELERWLALDRRLEIGRLDDAEYQDYLNLKYKFLGRIEEEIETVKPAPRYTPAPQAPPFSPSPPSFVRPEPAPLTLPDRAQEELRRQVLEFNR